MWWNSPALLSLRSVVRRSGILRLQIFWGKDSHRGWRREFEQFSPESVPVSVGSVSLQMLTRDAGEYGKVMAARKEERMVTFLKNHLRPGDICWDIGASIGLYTVCMAKLVGPQGRVLSFEPEPASYQRILANCAFNEVSSNVRAFNQAMGAEKSVAQLSVCSDPASGMHSLLPVTPQRGGQVVEVKVERGDDWRKEAGEAVPALVKVDVEGFEEQVLLGLGETLEDPACRALLVEVHFALLESTGQSGASGRIETLIQAFGFKTKWLDRSHLVGERMLTR